MFKLLCDKAHKRPGRKLKYHVRFLLDEMANIGQIPNFEKIISVIRSRNMSACVILQEISQLESIYEKKYKTIVGNCDSILFLGGSELSTLEWLSKMLGKETIDTYNATVQNTPTGAGGGSTNYQKTGKELMSIDELRTLNGEKCVLIIRGVNAFISNKFNCKSHARWGQLQYGEVRGKNCYDIKRAVEDRAKRRVRISKK
jgi:type IV secretion system protein VirD4